MRCHSHEPPRRHLNNEAMRPASGGRVRPAATCCITSVIPYPSQCGLTAPLVTVPRRAVSRRLSPLSLLSHRDVIRTRPHCPCPWQYREPNPRVSHLGDGINHVTSEAHTPFSPSVSLSGCCGGAELNARSFCDSRPTLLLTSAQHL